MCPTMRLAVPWMAWNCAVVDGDRSDRSYRVAFLFRQDFEEYSPSFLRVCLTFGSLHHLPNQTHHWLLIAFADSSSHIG